MRGECNAIWRFTGLILFWGLCGALLVFGQGKRNLLHPAPKDTPPEASLKSYVQRVRAEHAAEERAPGSIWAPTEIGRAHV